MLKHEPDSDKPEKLFGNDEKGALVRAVHRGISSPGKAVPRSFRECWQEMDDDFKEEVLRFEDIHQIKVFVDGLIGRVSGRWESSGLGDLKRLRYALSESILNAWKHGNICDDRKSVVVRYRFKNGFEVEVIDEGKGFDIDEVPDPASGMNIYEESGRGIKIIKYFASSVTWDQNGRRTIMSFA